MILMMALECLLVSVIKCWIKFQIKLMSKLKLKYINGLLNIWWSVIDYIEEYLEEILMEQFKSEKSLKDKLLYTENKVMLEKNQKVGQQIIILKIGL